MELSRIRNFCIIAHIDHGKSTLADRLLEFTGTIDKREMQEQVMDQMELERERGITIKAKAVRLLYSTPQGEYQLNLIDTPGHVDFTYEVSRSLAACEGALLVVDASQGIQAQTIANVYIALEHSLTLIPVINKIDLPNAQPQRVAQEVEEFLGIPAQEVLLVSAKEGMGIEELLQAIIHRLPPPRGDRQAPLKALVFDAKYDSYKGVLAYVRVREGKVGTGDRLRLMASSRTAEAMEVGIFRPQPQAVASLEAGEVGYVATGLKSIGECPVGETLTAELNPDTVALLGYRPVKPMVFAGLYTLEAKDYLSLKDALEKLKLSDAALVYEPESSQALGFGFRGGFLGLLHLDIVRERLEREYGLSVLVTAPSVALEVKKRDGSLLQVESPAQLPAPHEIAEVKEPWLALNLVAPHKYLGQAMEMVSLRGGELKHMEYLSDGGSPWSRVLLKYEMPLRALLGGFYDELKSRTQGYASVDYEFSQPRPISLSKLEILVNRQPVDALSRLVPAAEAYSQGRAIVEKLRHLIPRQLFDVSIQAAIGGKVIARETVKALRKDVLAKCYGGDVTRKRKLLEKQAEGKKRLKKIGQVEVPQEAFWAVLKEE